MNAQAPMLTAAEKADGWKLMFDGKSLAGWRGYKTEKRADRLARRERRAGSRLAAAAT